MRQFRAPPVEPATQAVVIWQTSNWEQIDVLKHQRPVRDFSFSPDGRHMATASHTAAYLWSSAFDKPKSLPHDATVFTVRFSLDGARLVTTSAWYAQTWRVQDQQPDKRFNHQGPVYNAMFSPDGSRVLTASNDNTARLWDARSAAELLRFTHRDFVEHIAFNRDGSRVLSGGRDGRVRLWQTQSPDRRFFVKKGIWHIGSNSAYRIEAGDDGRTQVLEVLSGNTETTLPNEIQPLALSVSPNDSLLAMSSLRKTGVRLWRLSDASLQLDLPHDSLVDQITFDSTGDKLATGSRDGFSRIWDVTQGTLITEFHHPTLITALAFNPQGDLIAIGEGKFLRVYKIHGNLMIDEFEHVQFVNAATFSPDGSLILTASGDNQARLWRIGQKNPIARFVHQFPITDAVFSDSGKLIATASSDTTARVWRLDTEQQQQSRWSEISRMTHNQPVFHVGFAFGDTVLLTATSNGIFQHWLEPTRLIDEVCRRLTKNLTMFEWYTDIAGRTPPRRTCSNLPDPWYPDINSPEP